MAICYVCDKRGSHIYTLKDYWRSPHTPEGMTKDDFVCYQCYHTVKKEIMQYKKENKKEIDRLNKEEKSNQKILEKLESEATGKEFDEIRSRYDKTGIIMYKDEYCAIVKKSDDIVFIKAFRELTREGYRMMAQDEGGEFHLPGASVGVDSTYFFQKIEYITPKNS